jgi:hypothetical protein
MYIAISSPIRHAGSKLAFAEFTLEQYAKVICLAV